MPIPTLADRLNIQPSFVYLDTALEYIDTFPDHDGRRDALRHILRRVGADLFAKGMVSVKHGIPDAISIDIRGG